MTTDPGYNEPPKKSNTLWFVLGGIGIVLVLICLGCAGCGGIFWYYSSNLDKQVESEAGIAVTAETLSKAYKDNGASANTTYQGKVVQVTGTVSKVISPTEIELAGTAGGEPVRCQASLSKLSLFQNTTAGQNVTVKGLCTGKPLGYLQVSTCISVTTNTK
jgi:hypothetical protein